jgi:hypothetical protein
MSKNLGTESLDACHDGKNKSDETANPVLKPSTLKRPSLKVSAKTGQSMLLRMSLKDKTSALLHPDFLAMSFCL